MTPPIRFLALVVGGWVAFRVVVLAPGAETVAKAPPVSSVRLRALAAMPALPASFVAGAGAIVFDAGPKLRRSPSVAPRVERATDVRVAKLGPAPPVRMVSAGTHTSLASLTDTRPAAGVTPASEPSGGFSPAATSPRAGSRWSASAWLLARGDDALPTAGVGLLGGSQTGARVAWRVNKDPARPLSLTGRLSSPLRRRGSEAAVGLEWQPVRALPVRLLAERRQRIDGDGRSAFALLAHGGVSERAVGAGWTLDAYAQAGMVGAQSRDLFADGGATVIRPLGLGPAGLAVGGGVWGSAQPGLARLDIGPRVTTMVAAGTRPVRVSLDWRFRVAGDAAPSSGPALTLATGF